ncbi:MAG TPA: hypothetical protein VFR95_03535, partial [Gemmatimonadaceae bacterium]|nr:hypothetical protein [Gemmatimonadaceae bacterium]
SEATREDPDVVHVVARDYAFQMPDTIPSGPTTFDLRNEGKEPHHLMLYRLDEGKTVRDAFAALEAGGAHPAWMHAAGGPNAVPNGGESVATVLLAPGSYVAFCHVKSRDGRIHFMKGMLKGMTVTPAAARVVASPAPDITVTLRDYSFEFSKPPTRGKHLVAVTNVGSQRHELILSLLQPGKTSRDFVTWLDTQNGPPPVTPYGGITDIEPGRTVVIPVELKAGDYSVVCRVRDAGDDAPHDRHGMLMDLEVR